MAASHLMDEAPAQDGAECSVADTKRNRGSQDQWQRDLAKSLKKAGEQLAVGLANEAVHRVSQYAERAHRSQREREEEREQLRLDRHRQRVRRRAEKRRQRWEEKYSRTSPAEGWAFAMIAAILLVLIVVQVIPAWAVFFPILMSIRSVQVLGYHAVQRREADVLQAELASHRDPRAARIDEVCDKLKAAVKDAPESVRSFLSKPEETVEALRKTSHDLLIRELSLRALLTPEETARLTRERNALQARVEMEPDEIVRQRLTGALAALDQQRTQHAEVAKSADRLEAERTRLGYTLEGLYAQIMRVRTADAASSELVSAGLRMSLDQLRDEMSALAEAVEDVNRTSHMEPPETFEASGGNRSGNRVR